MSFSTVVFIFAFLPFVLLIYFISPKKLKNSVLLISNLAFYASYFAIIGRKSIIVLLFSIICNYVIGLLLHYFNNKQHLAKGCLLLGILCNLFPLFYLKYFNFAVTT